MLTTEHMDTLAATNYVQAGAGVAGVLNGAKLIFGTTNISPSKVDNPAVIVQSPDADLAPVTITWGTPFRDALTQITVMSQLVAVKIAVLANACTIRSIGLTDSTGAHLLGSEDLGAGYALSDLVSLWNVQIPFSPSNPELKPSVWTN